MLTDGLHHVAILTNDTPGVRNPPGTPADRYHG